MDDIRDDMNMNDHKSMEISISDIDNDTMPLDTQTFSLGDGIPEHVKIENAIVDHKFIGNSEPDNDIGNLEQHHDIGNFEPHADELASSEPPTKRRRKKSIVWEYFTVQSAGENTKRACCKKCKQTFAYSNGNKVAGTSHLKRHIELGTCPVLRRKEKNLGLAAGPPKRNYTGRSRYSQNLTFDYCRSRHEIAEMIILHEYPLHMVEHSGFVAFVRNLQPQFNMVDVNTVQADCLEIYSCEKQDLANLLGQIPGRISLALDLWISSQTVGYVLVTGSFIDSNWKLHKRILNVVVVPFPYNGEALNHAVGVCLADWGLVSRLFTLTLDQGIWNGIETQSLRGFLSVKNPLILGGQFLIEHCYSHFLSSMAQDGLVSVREAINKIRESIKYVKTSMVHEQKFLELKEQLQVPSTKTLFLDDQTQWNSTYLMLMTSLELKEVFSCLDTADPEYKLSLSMEEWKQIEILCGHLREFDRQANVLGDPASSTANNYFYELWKVYMDLNQAAMSEDDFERDLVEPMKEKWDKYWSSCNLVLAFAVVMDPRFKMKFVEYSFGKIYGDNASSYVKIVDDGIHELYSEYVIQPLMMTAANAELRNSENIIKTEATEVSISSTEASLGPSCDRLLDFDVFIHESSTTQQTKSELDQYLEEALLPRIPLDVLAWWKLNELKYPILSKMARDILPIPVSTGSSESAFKIEGNKLDVYRSSLQPEILEALICAKDWLRCQQNDQQI
ncbi:hypothetical protein MKW94_024770 [Papaver nudicaule]|uniref:BED-type domain-containing protein n=1 Tax=Papaver nudicaule TaxID=74823 RepID=A0AA41V722_PAPNU|nr:hypothetical protein [Papaver nudicaule]